MRQLISAFFLLFLIYEIQGGEGPAVEDGVLVLTKDDFQSTIDNNKYVLVEFYAPWCGHCKQLAPEYVKAAQLLEKDKSPIKLAKVDATQEGELAEQYGVRGYPTLKFFIDKEPIEYGGSRQAQGIVDWVKKKTGPAAKLLESMDDAKAFIENSTVAIIGFFRDPECKLAKIFMTVAATIDDYPFAISHDSEMLKEYNAADTGSILLFKKFDEEKVIFEGESTVDAVKTFVMTQSLPLVVEFNHETATKIFGGEIKSHLLLFLSKKDGHYEKYLDGAKNVAKGFREKLLFVTINTDEEDHVRILEFFGMKKEELPAMRVIRLEEDMAKFKPDTDEISEETMKKFVTDFLSGNVKQNYLSQELPANWDAKPVKVLVASNFESVALDSEKDVLVEFYAPWCGHCKQLVPIYDQLAEKFVEEKRDDVVIAKIDATANEFEFVKITSFPTITLYKKGDNKPVEYGGERTLEALMEFVNSGGEKSGKTESESKEEEVPRDEL